MVSNRADDPAFPGPVQETVSIDIHEGMTIRTWLAGTIAAGYRANGSTWFSGQLATKAVEDADAIIRKLNE